MLSVVLAEPREVLAILGKLFVSYRFQHLHQASVSRLQAREHSFSRLTTRPLCLASVMDICSRPLAAGGVAAPEGPAWGHRLASHHPDDRPDGRFVPESRMRQQF